jgi:LDH2 family malate/lactate/ureidoglycolate dehydrogenase
MDPTTDTDAVDTAVFPAGRLRHLSQQLFCKAGMPAVDARMLADHLLWADLRGISWLGVSKIPQYLTRLRTGSITADAIPEILAERPSLLLIDGHDGFGQVVCNHAMSLVVGKARLAGVAAGVVRNTTSAGALGYFAMLAAEQQMIGLAINNSLPLQAAPGGGERIVGNQGFAIASPASRHSPLLLDMATSAITWARIHDYAKRGQPLPEGVALTADGESTVDPAAAMRGILLPMGGHRGFGLALMWEVLTGVLAGGDHFSVEVGSDAVDRPEGVSVFLLAIDPTAAMPLETYLARVDQLIDTIHTSKPGAAGNRVTVPGERSDQIRARRETDGIPVPADLLRSLHEAGAELGVTL